MVLSFILFTYVNVSGTIFVLDILKLDTSLLDVLIVSIEMGKFEEFVGLHLNLATSFI